ncbi:MAG: Mov34/MPN/PAD-1 family protein [Actinomycetota bacterium]
MFRPDSPLVMIPSGALHAMVARAYETFPEECCGLLIGERTAGRVARFVPITNVAASAKLYTIDPKEHLRTELAAEAEGLEVIGVVHSHTHTEPYPSPTDVNQAPDPGWHYVIVGLKRGAAEIRSYLIVDGGITEEMIVPV